MTHNKERTASPMAWGMLVLVAAACGGDDTSSRETSQTEADAATGASAGKPGSSTSKGSKPTASDSVDAAVSMSMEDTTTTGGKGGTKGQAAMAGSRSGQPADDHEDAGVSTDDKGGSRASAADAGSGTDGQAGASAGDTATDSDPSKGAVTFTKVYALFATTCAGAKCHVNADEAGDVFSMSDQATAYMNLVNADAVRCVGAKRVVPGEPDKSQLVHTLQHTALSGCAQTPKMPAGQPMLRQTDVDLVLSWIKNGANNE